MIKSLERIRSQLDTTKYSHSLNLIHLENVFAGYMDTVRDRPEADNPFSPGGASATSWDTGAAWAEADLKEGALR